MIGFRVLDVGLLVVWLVWFFRLRDDDDSDGGGGPGGEGPEPEPTGDPGGGGLVLPLGQFRSGARRMRDHVRPAAAASRGAARSRYRLRRPPGSGDRRLRRRSTGVRARSVHSPRYHSPQNTGPRSCGLWSVDCGLAGARVLLAEVREALLRARRLGRAVRLGGGGLGRRAGRRGAATAPRRRQRWWRAAAWPVCRRCRPRVPGWRAWCPWDRWRRCRPSCRCRRSAEPPRPPERSAQARAGASAPARCRHHRRRMPAGPSDHPKYQREGPSHRVVSARRRADGGRSAGSR